MVNKGYFSNKLFIGFFIIFLYLVGFIHWLGFFNYGALSFNALDWPKEFKYCLVLKQSLSQHVIPYHVSELFQATNRFLALPEINLSPQIILLLIMSVSKFIVFNTLFMYSIGFIGCLLLKERYRLSILPFTVLSLIFNFNGYITSHIAVGHSMWNGYFLLPFFCLYMLELIEDKNFVSSTLKLSFILFAILLQGAFHIFIWCLLFSILFAIFNKEFLRPVLSTMLLTLMLSSFRLIPAAITFHNKGYSFITGYSTPLDIFYALTVIRDYKYRYLGGLFGNLGSWEFDAYIGILGLVIIAYFGIYLRFRKNQDFKNRVYKELDMPISLMTLLSLSYPYVYIALLPIPFLNAERVSSRFLIIPLLILLIISCIRLQKLVHIFKKNAIMKLLSTLGILGLFYSLMVHSRIWNISAIEKYFNPVRENLSIQIINQQEPFYKFSVKIAIIVSLVSALLLFYFWHTCKNRKQVG